MLLTLSVITVFVTTYMLILPAVTLVREKAAEMGGIDVPAVEEEITDAGHEDTGESKDGLTEEGAKGEPDVSTKDDSNLLYEGEKYSIVVTDKKNVLPSDTKVEVKEISAEKNLRQNSTNSFIRMRWTQCVPRAGTKTSRTLNLPDSTTSR